MIQKAFKNFVEEAELFFVTKFINSEKIEKEFSECLDILYDLSHTKDTTKGIIAFHTRYGVGKSFFFEVVNHRHRRKYKKNLFFKTSAKELAQIYTSAGKGEDPQEKLLAFITVKNLFIDDIGDEGKEKVFHHYSNRLNVLRYVLLKRYEFWTERGWKTFATTNLTQEEIAQNYDGRVADRIMQMVHWREFNFLAKGSFRQITETRKLTQQEIEANWKKLQPKKKQFKIDKEKFFNELIAEPDSYFENKDITFWTFVKDYLLEKGHIKASELESITEQSLEASELLLRRDARETTRMRSRHSVPNVIKRNVEEAMSSITKHQVRSAAENVIARNKFFELKKKNHKF